MAGAVVASLLDHGLVVRLLEDEAKELDLPAHEGVESVPLEDADPTECELALVIGGDGTILRAAELTHGTRTPLLGVNLGHVGFLAEAESEDVEKMIEADRRPALHQRGAADPRRRRLPRQGGHREHLGAQRGQRGEGSPPADARGRRRGRRASAEPLRVRRRRVCHADGVDGVQLQRRWTGRLARRGGPADGPDQRARIVLTTRWWWPRPRCWPSRCSPRPRAPACSGATVGAPSTCRPGARIEVRRGRTPIRLVRLHQAPFTDRLVAKFGLPVDGWRGSVERRRRSGDR